ncbi:unnamed protein product [Brassicogethes aeneus]|uniref:Uncharacterized protein n=1 Tax=Brassicogethes aeneus TaxID=1431903 RepID=A0A9P0BGC9_BRAAE|nr:unnamed protein product [Brassicogethes aeneus]
MKQTNRNSANSAACDVMALWERAGIPTKLKKDVIKKIENKFNEWQKLKKNKENKFKRSEGLRNKEKEWQNCLEDLFDIAHADALNRITIEEDRLFLIEQRKRGRPVRAGPSTADLEVPPKRKRGRKNIFDERLSASLDYAKLSDRKAAVVLTSMLKSTGTNPSEFNINSSSIRRQRIKQRQRVAESLKKEFNPNTPLAVHWDGKRIEDIIGHKTVDRLPILVSGQGVDQLLAVPKLSHGTGEACASAVYDTILSWNLSDKIKCFCFDTTAVNTDPDALRCVENIVGSTISFAEKQLNDYQPRDDYKKLLTLTIIFLGGVPNKRISFRAPAGLHRARWMAKSIYCLKIFMFRDQFKLTKNELKAITEICVFVVTIYVRCWFQAPVATSAPRNDLWLLKNLKKFENINKAMSKKALTKFLGHLWYLSEELVALAFFDEEVSLEIKQKMVIALNEEGPDYSPKRITLDLSHIEEKNIEDFVTSNTLRFFRILGIPSAFLQKEPRLWEEDEDYKASREIVRSMRVVNDIAERGVALIEEFYKLITTDEEQKQFLLLVLDMNAKEEAKLLKWFEEASDCSGESSSSADPFEDNDGEFDVTDPTFEPPNSSSSSGGSSDENITRK